jgi:hypothetical protein
MFIGKRSDSSIERAAPAIWSSLSCQMFNVSA